MLRPGLANMPAGRPSKYTPELLERAGTYLSVYEDEGDVIPSAVGLAVFLGVAKATIYAWAAEEGKEVFSDTLDAVQAKQEKVLWNMGLKNEFNSTITKLALANHGYSDKAETQLTGANGGPVQVDTETHVHFHEA